MRQWVFVAPPPPAPAPPPTNYDACPSEACRRVGCGAHLGSVLKGAGFADGGLERRRQRLAGRRREMRRADHRGRRVPGGGVAATRSAPRWPSGAVQSPPLVRHGSWRRDRIARARREIVALTDGRDWSTHIDVGRWSHLEGSYLPAPPAAVGMLTAPTGLRRHTFLLYPIERGWPDSSACGGARGASLPSVQLPLVGATVLRAPPPSPSGQLLPSPSLTVCRPWRRARCGGLPPLALRVPPAAGSRCLPRARPLAVRLARRHRRLRTRGQPIGGATPPSALSPPCARCAWWQPRHGLGRSPERQCRGDLACRHRRGDL